MVTPVVAFVHSARSVARQPRHKICRLGGVYTDVLPVLQESIEGKKKREALVKTFTIEW